MKRLGIFLFAIALAVALFFMAHTSYATEATITISMDNDGYALYQSGVYLRSYDGLGESLEYASGSGGKIFFDDIRLSEDITFPKGSYNISGNIMTEGNIVFDKDTSIRQASNITCERIYVRGARLDIVGGAIHGQVILDGYSSSCLRMSGGEIRCSDIEGAIEVEQGGSEICGGYISNAVGYAIRNYSTLSLGSVAILEGAGSDLFTTTPVSLSVNGLPLLSTITCEFAEEMKKGTLTPIFYNCSGVDTAAITLIDICGVGYSLRFFEKWDKSPYTDLLAVARPYTVELYLNEEKIIEEYYNTDIIKEPGATPPEGFVIEGWYMDRDLEKPFAFGDYASDDLKLYAEMALAPFQYSVSSLRTIYDGEEHLISFEQLYHPLNGVYTYQWYNDKGEMVSQTDSLGLCYVAESGFYSCEITFTYGGYTKSIVADGIEAVISKRRIKEPTIESVFYNGEQQIPTIPKSSLYTAEIESYVDVGNYDIPLVLLDYDNNAWEGGDGDTAFAAFEIKKANNEWLEELSVKDVYLGTIPSPTALGRFGEVTFLYSISANGTFDETIPTDIGIYYIKAVIADNKNYFGAESEPRKFEILKDIPVLMSILSPPEKTSYTSFEFFDRSGLALLVRYKSGNEVEINGDSVAVRYQSADSFRARDSLVFLEYRGVTLPISVDVSRASYGLHFSIDERRVSYNGLFQSIPFNAPMPTGLDGISPSYEVIGGGKDSGKYEVSIIFSTESEEYYTPEPIYTSITVLPLVVEPYFESTHFIYDGLSKCPSGYYFNINGAKAPIVMNGGQVLAGDDYVALCSTNDANYLLSKDSVSFIIERAEYDLSGAYWSMDEYVYNGTAHRVSLCGLPNGLTILGYTDNIASEAGEYLARVKLAYDEKNYYPPEALAHRWRILPAEYDLSSFSIEGGERIFNGEWHYPTIKGELPLGLDGIALEVVFGEGLLSATEGSVKLLVEFSTKSKNYTVPEPIVVQMTILPREIMVIWSKDSFSYNGCYQAPLATAEECAILVNGGGISAGKYIAIAEAQDRNYSVTNRFYEFEISKAVNYWITEPSCPDTYFGRAPKPQGSAYYGECETLFYRDAGLTEELQPPLPVGEFYCVLQVEEGENYHGISSDAIKFAVIEVVPLELDFRIKVPLVAFDRLGEEDIECIITYNDGTRECAAWEMLTISYQSADSPRVGDSNITVLCMGLEESVSISVEPAVLDFGNIQWSELNFVYDGTPKTPSLIGLPVGVTLLGFEGGGQVNAGSYTVYPILDYDKKNLVILDMPRADMVIEKRGITPEVLGAIYNGDIIMPVCKEDMYIAISNGFRDAGEYLVPIRLLDTDNYYLTGDSARLVIEPMVIKVKVCDRQIYLFESITELKHDTPDDISALGIELEYHIEGDLIYAECTDKNYRLEVSPGRLDRVYRLNPDIRRAVYICFILFIMFALLLFIIVRRRGRIADILFGKKTTAQIPAEPPRLGCGYLSVDLPHAEDMITDPIARTLIRKETEVIYTSGAKRAYINVDTLCEHFEPGDRVDINGMKEKGIVPRDALTVRVLGRGVMDRPLFIYANYFSLSAVKMIALTGGEAHKVISQRKDGSEQ